MANCKLLQPHFETFCVTELKLPPKQTDVQAPLFWSLAASLTGNQACGGMTLACPLQNL